MWRRLLWWTTERPAVLPWAILLSALLLLLGDSVRQSISTAMAEYLYAPFYFMKHRVVRGYIGLQDHHDTVWFRNLRIKRLP